MESTSEDDSEFEEEEQEGTGKRQRVADTSAVAEGVISEQLVSALAEAAWKDALTATDATENEIT